MATPTSYKAGSVSVTANSATVVGTDTLWLGAAILPGDVFCVAGLTVSVASVGGQNSLTLSSPWPGLSISNTAYEIRYTPDATRVLTNSREALRKIAEGEVISLQDVQVAAGAPGSNVTYAGGVLTIPRGQKGAVDFGDVALATGAPGTPVAYLPATGTLRIPRGADGEVTSAQLSAVSNQVALKADAATVDLGLAQKASVALEHAVKLDGDALRVTDAIGFEFWQLARNVMSAMGRPVMDFSDTSALRLVDPAGFEIFYASTDGLRWMGLPISTPEDRAAALSGITQQTPRPMQRWRKARAGVVQRLSRARIACIGDSNTSGHAALDGAAKRAYSYPAALAKIAGEYRPSWANVFGNAVPVGSGGSGYQDYDPRVTTLPAGWGLSGASSIGGSMWRNTSTTNAVVFDPGIVWDRAEVWVAVDIAATLELGVPGSRISFSPAIGSVQKLTYTAPTAADQVLEIARVSGPVQIIGWHCYDSASPGLDVLNCGRTSWRTDQYADQSAYHSPLTALPSLEADLWLVQLGLNDFNQNRSPTDYRASLTAIVDRAAAIGVPVVLIVSMSPGVSRDHPWQAYADVIRTLGAERNLPVLDVGVRFGPFAEGAANGFIADTLHPNAYGYAETARLIYNLLNL